MFLFAGTTKTSLTPPPLGGQGWRKGGCISKKKFSPEQKPAKTCEVSLPQGPSGARRDREGFSIFSSRSTGVCLVDGAVVGARGAGCGDATREEEIQHEQWHPDK